MTKNTGLSGSSVYQNVVCDVHLADMKSVKLIHPTGALHKLREGFAACPANGCDRFFGTEGYCDLTTDSEFASIRTEPCCSSQHQPVPMYIQRTTDRLQWVCPLCYA